MWVLHLWSEWCWISTIRHKSNQRHYTKGSNRLRCFCSTRLYTPILYNLIVIRVHKYIPFSSIFDCYFLFPWVGCSADFLSLLLRSSSLRNMPIPSLSEVQSALMNESLFGVSIPLSSIIVVLLVAVLPIIWKRITNKVAVQDAPPTVPYIIPWIGHLPSFAYRPKGFIDECYAKVITTPQLLELTCQLVWSGVHNTFVWERCNVYPWCWCFKLLFLCYWRQIKVCCIHAQPKITLLQLFACCWQSIWAFSASRYLS